MADADDIIGRDERLVAIRQSSGVIQNHYSFLLDSSEIQVYWMQ